MAVFAFCVVCIPSVAFDRDRPSEVRNMEDYLLEDPGHVEYVECTQKDDEILGVSDHQKATSPTLCLLDLRCSYYAVLQMCL
jgi:hypothetical protein